MGADKQPGDGVSVSLSQTLRKQGILHVAWRKVRENGVRSLSDETREKILAFDAIAHRALRRISDQLRQGRFEFAPQYGVRKMRKGKDPRPLVVAPIENRIVHRAILDVLQAQPFIREIIDTPTSIGGVPERGRQHAVALTLSAIQRGAKYFIRSDIEGFFTKIPRTHVLNWLSLRCANDTDFIDLVSRATETSLENLAHLGDDALLFPLGDEGVAQGNPLSPLLGNILLHEFDVALNGRGIMCVRYIDDFIVLGPSPSSVQKAFANAQRMFSELGLRAYDPMCGGEAKAESGTTSNGFEFLGCQVSPGLVQPTREAQAKIITHVDAILAEGRQHLSETLRREGSNVPRQRYVQTLDRVDRTLRGWSHAYSFCNGRNRFDFIDAEIDARCEKFGEFARRLLAGVSPTVRRRIIGVYVLADSPLEPLPHVEIVPSSSIQGTEIRLKGGGPPADTMSRSTNSPSSTA